MMGIWDKPSLFNSPQAAPSWPLPPSIRIRFGRHGDGAGTTGAAPATGSAAEAAGGETGSAEVPSTLASLSNRLYLRRTTSAIDAKSSWPSTVLILNRR